MNTYQITFIDYNGVLSQCIIDSGVYPGSSIPNFSPNGAQIRTIIKIELLPEQE